MPLLRYETDCDIAPFVSGLLVKGFGAVLEDTVVARVLRAVVVLGCALLLLPRIFSLSIPSSSSEMVDCRGSGSVVSNAVTSAIIRSALRRACHSSW